MDLEYFGRGLLGPWPQADIGIVLWSLSVSADDWQTSDKLTRMCTIPEPATLTGTWDKSASALEAKTGRCSGLDCWKPQRKDPERPVRDAELLPRDRAIRAAAQV